MTWSIIAVVIIIGLLLLVLEILVIPGTGIVGVLGFGCVIFGIYETYVTFGNTAGHITVASTVFLSAIAIYLSIRANTWKKLSLKSEIKSQVNLIDSKIIKVGDKGIAIARLAPSGKARINDELYEVHTFNLFVDENTEVEVIKIEASKVWVKPINIEED
ncbi:MAG: NfeD family protein [Saprospiraceae bacterium]|nr:NfeD family protein [Saprospiraceae bacterium]